MTETPPDFGPLLGRMRSYFASGKTRSFESRMQALDQLEKTIRDNQEQICTALFADIHKPKQEALIAEVAVVLEEIQVTKKNLRRWMRPEKRKTPLSLFPAKSRIYFEPLGVVLIIGPWNYPFQLTMSPLIGAIAAGNCAVIKPAGLTPQISRLIAELVQKSFPADYVQVIEGGIPETTALLSLPFDHIFFTGSIPVGKIVMQAAAKNLVPVTLELGGKSPVIVCEDSDLDLAARRIVWGKFYNAGQTCVAPDYLYAHSSIAPTLIAKIQANILSQFGESAKDSQSYARIINSKNCQRLAGMIDPAKVLTGGKVEVDALYIQPTLLGNVSWSDPVMQEEIFGPLLPILTYENLEDVFRTINAQPKALAGYLFSNSSEKQKQFIEKVSFGGGCINDVVVHLSNPYIPFGGVGASGMGHYHGKSSFTTFSHSKSMMHRSGTLDLSARYAPYDEKKLNFLRRLFGI